MPVVKLDYREVWTRLNWLDRPQLEKILMDHSIQSHSNEDDNTLKQAIIANLEDGEISMDEIPEWK